MIRYSYQLNNFRQWLRGFSEVLRIPTPGSTLIIPRELGEGSIHTIRMSHGISAVCLNFFLSDDFQLVNEPSKEPGLSLFFTQIKSSELYIVRDVPASEKNSQRGNILLTSTGRQNETIVNRNARMKGVGIYFPPAFLQHYVSSDIRTDLFQKTEHPYSEPIPFECRQLLEDIFNTDPKNPLYHLVLRNRTQTLAEKFLSSFLNRSATSFQEGKTWAKGREKDLEALKSIVRILSDVQLNKFPSIEALSKTAMMSSTKLKSRFKQIYGMKLYEFYNHNRLEQAKAMLKTGKFSVKQVGVNIGFSNLSNFAKAFKKEFGVLPKEVLKNK